MFYPSRARAGYEVLSWWYVRVLLITVGAGLTYGLVAAVTRYPLASWFGVTLWVGILGAVVGTVLGLAAGTIALVVRSGRHRA